LRDSDVQALREKGAEILQLQEEVQRLAGEVEFPRGVVEDGRKERHSAREIFIEGLAADLGMSQDLEEEEDNHNEDELELEEEPDDNEHERSQGQSADEREYQEEEEDKHAPFDLNPVPLHAADRTMRADFATFGSSTNSAPSRFVDDDELDLIAAEVEERRSNCSNASSVVGSRSGTQRMRSWLRSLVWSSKRATVEDAHKHEEEVEKTRRHYLPPALPASSQAYSTQPQLSNQHTPSRFASSHPEPSTSRSTASTPGYASRTHEPRRTRRTSEPAAPEPETETDTPFPQIRGEHLERLFFSAPEHIAKTCTVCYKRWNRPSGASPSWPHLRRKGTTAVFKTIDTANFFTLMGFLSASVLRGMRQPLRGCNPPRQVIR
jgi:hypothetical protein